LIVLPIRSSECFNPRARAGRDRDNGDHGRSARTVSIHAPARGATLTLCREASVGPVSIHAPARGATDRQLPVEVFDLVSIHAPARGATALRPDALRDRAVSIHAPARGATIAPMIAGSISMFQSTRPRGARPPRKNQLHACALFQSTRPRGARPQAGRLLTLDLPVSIHAPARGATRARSRATTT